MKMGRPEESKILLKLMRRSTREVAFKIENSKVGGTRNSQDFRSFKCR